MLAHVRFTPEVLVLQRVFLCLYVVFLFELQVCMTCRYSKKGRKEKQATICMSCRYSRKGRKENEPRCMLSLGRSSFASAFMLQALLLYEILRRQKNHSEAEKRATSGM